MKSFEIQPTDENILSSLLNDSIGRNQNIRYFIQCLDNLEGHWSVSLDGQWGSGKTFFVKQAKLVMEAFNVFLSGSVYREDGTFEETEENEQIKAKFGNDLGVKQKFLPIYYDAWSNDNDEDPILSLIYQIIQNVVTYYDIKDLPKLKKIISNIGDSVTGKKIKLFFDAIKTLESFKTEDPFEKIKEAKDLQNEIDEFFNHLHIERADRIVIFIDELDRCKPTFAVTFLERIKHYFTNENIIFVFSVNSSELQKTIRKFYGTDFKAYEYLSKFFDLRLNLPKTNMSMFYSSLGIDDNKGHWYDAITEAVIQYFKFDMRLISQYFLIEQSCSFYSLHSRNDDFFCESQYRTCTIFVPIIIGLYIYDIELYEKFINGDSPEILIEIIHTFVQIVPDYYEHIGSYLLGLKGTEWSQNLIDGIKLLYKTIMKESDLIGFKKVRVWENLVVPNEKSFILNQVSPISKNSDLIKYKK